MKGGINIHTTSKIAVIGPQDIVTECISLQSSFPSLNLQPFIYQSDQETLEIVMQLSENFHYILFSGPIPYNNVINHEKVRKISNSYIPYHGSSLIRALFQAYQIGALHKFSYDTVYADLLIEAFVELGVSEIPKYMVAISLERDGLFLANYHKSLFEEGETIGAVTSSAACYSILLKEHIPCIKIKPLQSTIREALEKVELACGRLHNMANQISIGVISVRSNNTKNKQNESGHLKIEQLVSIFVEKLDAQYVRKSSTMFLFITTRAMIEKQTNSFTVFPSMLKSEEVRDNVMFSIGVGIGGTTNSALKSAYVALKEAENYVENCLFLLDEAQKSIGPLTQSMHSNSIQLRTTDAYLLSITEKAGLSTKTLYRMLNAIKQVGDEFTVNEIAPYMGVSIKNMQRICRKFEIAGALRIVGKETLESKGKPRRVYRLNEEKEILTIKGR